MIIKGFNGIILLTGCCLLISSCSIDSQEKGTIKIINNSPDTVSEVTVHYLNAGIDDTVGKLEPDQAFTYIIKYHYEEDSIEISYIDSLGKKYSKTAVGYAAKYDKQRYSFEINQKD